MPSKTDPPLTPLPPAARGLRPFSLCVYCGSRSGLRPTDAAAARAVGRWLGERGCRLVYGGGERGLMGEVARATLAHGGTVLGIIPQALVDMEVAKTDCTELRVVQTMHERKALMMDHADAFVALPGGIGTLEELFEVWAWHHLGYHAKPFGLLNAKGFYDGLLRFLQHAMQTGFVSEGQMALLHVGEDVEPLLEVLYAASLCSEPAPSRSQLL